MLADVEGNQQRRPLRNELNTMRKKAERRASPKRPRNDEPEPPADLADPLLDLDWLDDEEAPEPEPGDFCIEPEEKE